MTNLLARLLLITFVAIASGQTCTFCPGGEDPRNGNLFVYVLNNVPLTCNDIATDILDNPPPVCSSPYANAAQLFCGCLAVKPGPCPGICVEGSALTNPNQVTNFFGTSCALVDQLFKGTPGDTICPGLGIFNFKEVCVCKVKPPRTPSPNNMGGGGKGGNEGTGNQGTGMSMPAGRQLRFGDLEEDFPPRAARGLAM